MFESLLRRLLRSFIERTVTVVAVTKVLDLVIGRLKAIAPDAVDQLLDAIPKDQIAQMVVEFVLGLLGTALPAFAMQTAPASQMPATISTSEVQRDFDKVTGEMVAKLAV